MTNVERKQKMPPSPRSDHRYAKRGALLPFIFTNLKTGEGLSQVID